MKKSEKISIAGLSFSLISQAVFFFVAKELRVNLYVVIPYIIICITWTYLIFSERRKESKAHI